MQDLWYSSVSLQCHMLQWLQMVCGNLNELGSVYTLVDFCEKKEACFCSCIFACCRLCWISLETFVTLYFIYSFCLCLHASFQSSCKEAVLHFIFSKYRIKFVKDGRLHTWLVLDWNGLGGSCFERTAVPWPCVYSAEFTSLSFLACCEAVAWGHG